MHLQCIFVIVSVRGEKTEIIQFAFYGHEPAEIGELVYDSLHGYLIPACRLPWVKVVFRRGHPSFDAYSEFCDIRDKVAGRLGCVDDRDLHEMTSCMYDYNKAIALEMFNYGRKFQKMLDEEQKQDTP